MSVSARVGLGCDPERASAGSPYSDPALLDALVEQAAAGAGWSATPAAGPLAEIVPRGATVLLKPNWVSHVNETGQGLDSLVTHPAFLLAVVRAVARCRPARIRIGDAPIQGCDLTRIVTDELVASLSEAAAGIPVEVRDFRRVRMQEAGLARERVATGRRDEDYVLFDFGSDSLLEPLAARGGKFRVTMYHPRALAETHRPGTHRYLLCREAFEADVLINLPKLKTHRKAGVTSALKNLVGTNGNKDYLPHHRLGGSLSGGDCYPGFDPVRRIAEFCLDRANESAGTEGYSRWHRRAGRLLRFQRRLRRPTDVEGGWFGNDTCWRMALDLNRLVLHGRADGTLAKERQRRIVSLVDAVVAGQGEGPLACEPLPLGCVLAGDDSACLDWLGAALLGMDPSRIPLVRSAFEDTSYPVSTARPEEIRVGWRGALERPEVLARRLGRAARLPAGWQGHCEAAS